MTTSLEHTSTKAPFVGHTRKGRQDNMGAGGEASRAYKEGFCRVATGSGDILLSRELEEGENMLDLMYHSISP